MSFDRDSDRRDHYVYRMFDADGQLLYIGCTKVLRQRWGTHNAERPHMTRRAVKFKVQGPYTYRVAREIEREALRTEDPEFGWTPAKRSEVGRRNGWINRRTEELFREGCGYMAASRQAVTEANEWWPNPVAHEYRPHSLRALSHE